jgi:hypothetical protein
MLKLLTSLALLRFSAIWTFLVCLRWSMLLIFQISDILSSPEILGTTEMLSTPIMDSALDSQNL